jgi:hypothetical protein
MASNAQQSAQFAASAELPSLQPIVAPPSAHESFGAFQQPLTPGNSRKRKSVSLAQDQMTSAASTSTASSGHAPTAQSVDLDPTVQEPKAKKSRTNTPWTPAEEQRLKVMRDAGNSWSEIAKVNTLISRNAHVDAHIAPTRCDLDGTEVADSVSMISDISAADRGERKETLVQGRHISAAHFALRLY